ncbi:MAG: hypothetical protein ACRDS0_14120 [Pseudonocardiaceae bacterium]
MAALVEDTVYRLGKDGMASSEEATVDDPGVDPGGEMSHPGMGDSGGMGDFAI